MYIYISIYIHIYIYIYIHTYIHTYTYTHVFVTSLHDTDRNRVRPRQRGRRRPATPGGRGGRLGRGPLRGRLANAVPPARIAPSLGTAQDHPHADLQTFRSEFVVPKYITNEHIHMFDEPHPVCHILHMLPHVDTFANARLLWGIAAPMRRPRLLYLSICLYLSVSLSLYIYIYIYICICILSPPSGSCHHPWNRNPRPQPQKFSELAFLTQLS